MTVELQDPCPACGSEGSLTSVTDKRTYTPPFGSALEYEVPMLECRACEEGFEDSLKSFEVVKSTVQAADRAAVQPVFEAHKRVSNAVERAMAKFYPWLEHLPPADRLHCVDEIKAVLETTDLDDCRRLRRVIFEWGKTAEIHADPELAASLRGPLNMTSEKSSAHTDEIDAALQIVESTRGAYDVESIIKREKAAITIAAELRRVRTMLDRVHDVFPHAFDSSVEGQPLSAEQVLEAFRMALVE